MGCKKSRRTVFSKSVAGLKGVTQLGLDVFNGRTAHPSGRGHKGCELILVCSGTIQYAVDGEKYEVGGGQMWKSVQSRKPRAAAKVLFACELFWVDIEPTAAGLKMNAGEFAAFKRSLSSPKRIARAPDGVEAGLRGVQRELADGNTVAARGLLLYTISVMARAFSEDIRSTRRRVPAGLKRALALIDSDIASPPTAAKLAKGAGLKSAELSGLFRDELGMTAADYIASRRVELAAGKLRETRVAIPIISKELGFRSVKDFNKTFKELMGETPKDYRGAGKRRPKR